MLTAILLLALLALAVALSRPAGPLAGPDPVDRDRERLLADLRAHSC